MPPRKSSQTSRKNSKKAPKQSEPTTSLADDEKSQSQHTKTEISTTEAFPLTQRDFDDFERELRCAIWYVLMNNY